MANHLIPLDLLNVPLPDGAAHASEALRARIIEAARPMGVCTTHHVLHALDLPLTRPYETLVGLFLKDAGYRRTRRMINGARIYVLIPPPLA